MCLHVSVGVCVCVGGVQAGVRKLEMKGRHTVQQQVVVLSEEKRVCHVHPQGCRERNGMVSARE